MEQKTLINAWYQLDYNSKGVFDAWTLQTLDKEAWQHLSRQGKSLYYCAYGLLAPTTHNTVLQKFKVDADGTIHVFLDRKWILPASDPEGRQAVISIGAVIETLMTAASAYHDHMDVYIDDVNDSSVHPYSEQDRKQLPEGVELVHLVTLVPSTEVCTQAEVNEGILKLLKTRKTVRAEFDRSDLKPALLDWVQQNNHRQDNDQPRLHAITNTAIISQFAKQFHKRAIQTAISNPRFQYELGEWLLPNDDTRTTRRMRGREFGRGDEATVKLRAGMLGERDQSADEIEGFAQAEMTSVASASAIFLITTSGQSTTHWIQAGRLYQRFALLLGEHGYHHSMQAALSETSFTEIKIANMAVKATLLKAPNRHIQVIFRAGRLRHVADGDRPHSARPDLRSLLV